jgi:16S rRNA (uracil1498-N3)-methyltransferase
MALFYHPHATAGANIELDAQEGLHISRVLRMKNGDAILMTDGRGRKISATVEIGKKSVVAHLSDIAELMPRESALTLAVAPTKNNERLEWFVEKAVEIGVEKIQFIQCRYSERTSLKTDRLIRIAVSALKQSERYYLPEILPVINFTDWLLTDLPDQRLIAHCHSKPERQLLKSAIRQASPACIAIGPEGDFSEAEIEAAMAKGFISVSLGQARLRTETAALAAVHTFELVNQSV